MKSARKAIGSLGLQIVTPVFEYGQVWRVPRTMKDLEIWSSLDKLPCVFPAASLYFRLEILEEARRERWFDFEALEYSPSKGLGSRARGGTIE